MHMSPVTSQFQKTEVEVTPNGVVDHGGHRLCFSNLTSLRISHQSVIGLFQLAGFTNWLLLFNGLCGKDMMSPYKQKDDDDHTKAILPSDVRLLRGSHLVI